MAEIRIPKYFYHDHIDRDLPAPPVIRKTKRHYWVERSHPDFAELINDAEYYAHPFGPGASDEGGNRSYVTAAKALLRSIKEE